MVYLQTSLNLRVILEHRTGFEPVSQHWHCRVLAVWTNDAERIWNLGLRNFGFCFFAIPLNSKAIHSRKRNSKFRNPQFEICFWSG
jgi:hypothetical protein